MRFSHTNPHTPLPFTIMYNDIANDYLEIFPLNQAFLNFIQAYIKEPGLSVLDLGCGPGDYVDTLSRTGCHATGIDSSDVMIAQAKVQKQGFFYNLSFTEINQLAGTYDCAFCVGNSLSYLSKDATQPFLQEVYNLLNPSGSFILQIVNWDRFLQIKSSDFPINSISDGRTFHRRYEWIDSSQIIFHTEIRRGKETIGSWAASLYPKYINALLADLQAAGLTITGKFGDYQKSPFNPLSSPATILTAKKL